MKKIKQIKRIVKAKLTYYLKGLAEKLIVKNNLTNLALNSIALGISNERYTANEVVVSLTSYGRRIYDVHLTIESIMQQSLKPNKIVLWLGNDVKDKPLPIVLQRQQKRGLEVRYVKDIKSYTKLIPALKAFPQATIITIDDDCWYHYYLLENLINEHKISPNLILATRVHRIALENNNALQKYNSWEQCYSGFDVSPLNFPTGVGGVLYPAHCFNDEVFNEEVFTKICPHADDVWFKAMALLNDTLSKNIITYSGGGGQNCMSYLDNNDSQEQGLYKINIKRNLNDIQLKAVFDRYNLYKKLILNN
ncbi:MAG: glycosyltransferase family 2 protein [Spirochaetaceae bacterium]|nr:glycosyltransferase family 2 protein [Spirochaetaceae bacterium]